MLANLPHLQSIQALRALAALMIVAMHLEGNLEQQLGDLDRFFYWFCFSGVDLFFVISGFVMVWRHWHERGQPHAAMHFFRLRLIRIFPNYWFFLLCTLALYHFIDYQSAVPIHWLASATLWPQAVQTHLLPVAWTLSHELWFYGVFGILLCLPARYGFPALALWVGVVAVGQTTANYTHDFGWTGFVFSAFQFQFLAGALAAWALIYRPCRFPLIMAIAGFVVLILSYVLSTYWVEASLLHRSERMWRGVLFAVGFGSMIYGLAGLELAQRLRSIPRCWVQLGDASYTLYLCHLPLLVLWQHLTHHLVPETGREWFALGFYAPCYLAITLGYSLWHHQRIEQPFTQWLRKKR